MCAARSSRFARWTLWLWLACLGAQAQTVYKCHDGERIVYGQAPCPGGEQIDVSDPRTPEQQAQAREIALRQAQEAKELESTRLQAEAARQAALQAELAARAQAARKAAAASEPQIVVPVRRRHAKPLKPVKPVVPVRPVQPVHPHKPAPR